LIGVVPLIGIIDIIVAVLIAAVVLLTPIVPFILLTGCCCSCCCWFTAFICGAMADGDDDDDALVVGWLTGAIVVPVGPPVGREIALVLLFEVFTCCCFGGVAVFVATVVDFVVVVCCAGDDDTADVGGIADDDAKAGFTVFGIPHMRASVVLTTLRLGLLGSHIFALSSGDIVPPDEVPLPAACTGDDDNDGDCCANT